MSISVKKDSFEESERKKYRLRTCILTNFCLFVMVSLGIWFFSDKESNRYLRFGPQKDLNLIGIQIDNWEKYLLLQLFLAFVQITDVVINEIASPILGFTIYNPDKDRVIGFGRCELQTYANIHWMLNSLRSTLMVLVTISQLDIAVLRVLYGEITSFYTINMLLKEKHFPEDGEYTQVKDLSDIEMV